MISSLEKILSRSCFIIDLDGVIYRGRKAIPGAIEAIHRLKQLKKKIAFVTNNSSRSNVDIHKKLLTLGISCHLEDVLTSVNGLVFYLKSQSSLLEKGVYAIGTDNLKSLLQSEGIRLVSPEKCNAFVVGLDPDFNYEKISQGLRALIRGVPFIVCNQDAYFPTDNGVLLPGCGAVVGAFIGASQRQPTVVVGKPNLLMLEIILNKLNWKVEDCVMVGDRLESDILFAKNAGMPSVLIKNEDSINSYPVGLEPSLTVGGLLEMVTLMAG